METSIQVKPFFYRGTIGASKSLFNRSALVQSFFPAVKVVGDSACDDVQHMREAVVSFNQKKEIHCGDAGTVLRFMGMRVSREPGTFHLTGSPRLLQRPQQDMAFILAQLGVQVDLQPHGLVIQGNGWKKPLIPIRVHREKSSQFATGLLLSSWDLPFDLELELAPPGLHDSYWNMSLAFAEQLGMELQFKKSRDHFIIPAHQSTQMPTLNVEPDYSSMFAIAALAALGGEARVEGVQLESLQPDYEFVAMMQKMKIPILIENDVLGVLKAPKILAQDFILRDTPDMFPVLSVLLAHADGHSRVSGAPRLIYKESNRIRKTADLLDKMGVPNEILPDGLKIEGQGLKMKKRIFDFDPDQDHRMAMAAGILQRIGWNIQLAHPEVVNKSFPEFWQILGLHK